MATPVSDDSSGAQTQGTALFPVVSFHAAHMFINSPLLHPPWIPLVAVCLLFPAGTLIQ